MAVSRNELPDSMKLLLSILMLSPVALAVETTEFCLDGELDLGARYQGLRPAAGEYYATSWCIITEGENGRVRFSGAGKSNPDMDGEWTVAYLPPAMVRIVNRASPPDIEFPGADVDAEIARIRRVDPRRLLSELEAADGRIDGIEVGVKDDRIVRISMTADMPLRGPVDVHWHWDWRKPETPALKITVEDDVLFRATGRWRELEPSEAVALWERTPGEPPIEIPGDRWPSTINMSLQTLDEDVYLVRGVRSGFQHLVVDTSAGLVVADAPAGWVEFHHLPPAYLTAGLGPDDLSRGLIEFLGEQLPERPLHAVILTHLHDDHAGGARAFADAGATVYAAPDLVDFFDVALGIRTEPVVDDTLIGEAGNTVRPVSMGPGPHADSMVGILAKDKGWFFVSDVHVPNSDAPEPREDRAGTECWFARWAVDNLGEDVRVINSHSTPVTPVSRLADYLSSESCIATVN